MGTGNTRSSRVDGSNATAWRRRFGILPMSDLHVGGFTFNGDVKTGRTGAH